jgi:hypothetical protein
LTFADGWPGGVVARPSPWNEPLYYIVYGPDDVDHGNTAQTIQAGSITNCPGYYTQNPTVYHDHTHTSNRPSLTFAGQFFGLAYAHESNGSYYSYPNGTWSATDYEPPSNPGGGGN